MEVSEETGGRYSWEIFVQTCLVFYYLGGKNCLGKNIMEHKRKCIVVLVGAGDIDVPDKGMQLIKLGFPTLFFFWSLESSPVDYYLWGIFP